MLYHRDSVMESTAKPHSLLMLRHFCSFFVLRLPLLCALLVLIRIFSHDVLEVTPKRFNGREFGTDLGNFFQGTVQLVDVLEDELETLEDRSVSPV